MGIATGRLRRLAGGWPWAALLLATAPAVWHAVDFPDDLDGEYPAIARPTFSPRPPSAYRLAEPGDTLDRLGVYFASAGIVLAGIGWVRSGRSWAWPAALGPLVAAVWEAATPWPTFDGWHGLNWRAVADREAPLGLRLALATAGLTLAAWAIAWAIRGRGPWADAWRLAGERRVRGLLAIAAGLVALKLLNLPNVDPPGYWPRWAFAWGLLAFDLALLRSLPPASRPRVAWAIGLGGAGAWAGLVAGGLALIWYHRPLERLKVVAPGRIYISAMPTYRGLEVAHRRHGFKTVINLFNEATDRRSPRLPNELRFIEEHGMTYVASPPDPLDSDEFLDQTLRLAQDPAAWPILVHCHGCMDRTPAWAGIYRFLVEGRPLAPILREIEQHRGHRPKASVTLLYNRVLHERAPDRWAADPTARILERNAAGTPDPYSHALRSAFERKGAAERR